MGEAAAEAVSQSFPFLDYQGVVLYLGGRETWSIIKAGRNGVDVPGVWPLYRRSSRKAMESDGGRV